MLDILLRKNEGKTLEFKENAQSLEGIIRTVIAFANTAGGSIVIGVKDGTKEIVGIKEALIEEERLASAIAENIAPLIRPDIEIQTYRNKEIIIIHVSHGVGPYYMKSDGPEKGVYVRLGSTNRVADSEVIINLRLLVKNTSFDQQPYLQGSRDSLDFPLIKDVFYRAGKTITDQKCQTMGIVVKQERSWYPSYGGIILFGTEAEREQLFPHAVIRCARFQGTDKVHFLDQKTMSNCLPLVLDDAIAFIDKHIKVRSVIGKTKRIDIPQYPEVALREAIINALVHTDYAMAGATITIAIFDDRIEITNPGGLPFGMTMEQILTGSSRVRNYVIARVFNALKLIEQWGTGIKRINEACKEYGLQNPLFQEINNQFRVTLYAGKALTKVLRPWQEKIIEYLKVQGKVSPQEAAKIWKINARTTRERLKYLVDSGMIKKIATAPRDPHAVYVLTEE